MGYIYAIRHKSSEKLYVGSTIDIESRIKQHFSDLRCGRHYNIHLQRSFNKYGENDFDHYIVEECDSNLLEREKYWIEKLDVLKRKYGFNISADPKAPMRGRKMPDQARKKIGRPGSKHGMSKISEFTISRIFELYKDGYNQKQISKIIGIHHTNISLILRGKAWKHVKIDRINSRTNNKSGCVGVYRESNSGKWRSEIIIDKIHYGLGAYENYEDAVSARKNAERSL